MFDRKFVVIYTYLSQSSALMFVIVKECLIEF